MDWKKCIGRILMNKKIVVPTTAFVVAAVLYVVLFAFPEVPADMMAGIRGPQVSTTLPQTPVLTRMDLYHSENEDALAILVNDDSSSWLGLAHGLKSIGVPFTVTTEANVALRHDVIMVYPMLTGSNTAPATLQALARHVRSGKTLIGFSVIGGGMPDVFGFTETVEHRFRDALNFSTADDFVRSFVSDSDEAQIRLAGASASDTGVPGVSYQEPKLPALASYGDGTAAITHNVFNTPDGIGHAYAIGIDFGHFILRAHNARFTNRASSYVNEYQPKLDSLLRFLAAVYQEGEPDSLTLYPTPNNKLFTALITHDVDFTQSMRNATQYAESEANQGIVGTYFIQTKYMRDYNDNAFFAASSADTLIRLDALGAEIASHTVAHSNEFRNMPLGSGTEAYPDYQPFVRDFDTVRDASIMGELRVSKFLLEQLGGQTVRAFRPGHLSLPTALPQALQASEYSYSSSVTANEVLTHLPFKLMYDRGYDAEVAVYELPVTIEDEAGRLGDRLEEAITIAHKIGRYGGLVNILIHTDITGHKLAFQEGFVDEFADSAHFTTVGDFGDWWAARDGVEWQISKPSQSERVVRISTEQTITGLTLNLPPQWRLRGNTTVFSQDGRRLVLPTFSGTIELHFGI